MAKEARPPFRSLRDLVLKELQGSKPLLVWNDDASFAEATLEEVLDSEAYLLDRSARDYLLDMASGLTIEDYYRSIANTRMPFRSVWIEAIFDLDEDDGETSCGALITEEGDGIKVFAVLALHDHRPWTPIYGGAEIVFHPDGNVSCTKTPIARLYDRMGKAQNLSQEDLLNRDIDKALRIGGVFALLCAAFTRPWILEREAAHDLPRSEAKAHAAAGRRAPRCAPSVIRLSKTGRAERATGPAAEGTGGSSRSAHWVRGHLFLARNGRLTWRRAHVRGSGGPEAIVHHVTE